MATIVVKFRPTGRGYHFDSGAAEVHPGQTVVVDTDQGLGIGEVVRVLAAGGPPPMKKMIRLADDVDLSRRGNLAQREAEARRFVLERIRERGLDMKLVAIDFAFDSSHLDVYFSSEDRIDFRNLLKDCTNHFHMRVEMKQIGARDAARMIGGVGPCGRDLCCSTWLPEFAPVNVKTVKLQNLSLNPTNITGVCGKLKCCLNYEADLYAAILKDLPKTGKRVLTPRGEGKVTGHNIFRGTIFVYLTELGNVEFPPGEALLASKVASGEARPPWLEAASALPSAALPPETSARPERREGAASRPDRREDRLEPLPTSVDSPPPALPPAAGTKLSEEEADFETFKARQLQMQQQTAQPAAPRAEGSRPSPQPERGPRPERASQPPGTPSPVRPEGGGRGDRRRRRRRRRGSGGGQPGAGSSGGGGGGEG